MRRILRRKSPILWPWVSYEFRLAQVTRWVQHSIIKNAWRDVKLNRVDFKPDVLKVISICNEKAIKDQRSPGHQRKIILSSPSAGFRWSSQTQRILGVSINHWRVNTALMAKWIFNFGSFKAQIKLPHIELQNLQISCKNLQT